MELQPCYPPMPLRRNEIQRWRGPLLVHAEHGTLWITVDGERDDVVLEPGQAHRFGPGARVLVHALGGDASARMQPLAPTPVQARPGRALRAVLGTLTATLARANRGRPAAPTGTRA